MKLAVFIRHGYSFRPKGIYLDEEDVFLSVSGRSQIASLGLSIQNFNPDKIVASPVRRCVETCEILQAFFHIPIEYDKRLRERSFPSLFNKKFSDISYFYGKHVADMLRKESEKLIFPNEETIATAMCRVRASVIQHVSETKEKVLFISHGGPHSWLLCKFLGLDIGSIRKFTLGEARLSLLEFEDNGSFSRILLLNSDGETMKNFLQLS